MITKSQALSARSFHENHEPGARVRMWRRNGATQTWKTRPGQFRVPVKYGLYQYGQITDVNAHGYHVAADCPDD